MNECQLKCLPRLCHSITRLLLVTQSGAGVACKLDDSPSLPQPIVFSTCQPGESRYTETPLIAFELIAVWSKQSL